MPTFDPILQHIRPFAESEEALSALLAVAFCDPTTRSGLFDLLRSKGLETDVLAALQEAERDNSIEVVREAWLAKVGNLDLALFSRTTNVILAIEHKTTSRLGKNQITKYRTVLKASDPRGDRKLATILLRPKSQDDLDGQHDLDRQHDPEGVRDSVEITHRDLLPCLQTTVVSRPLEQAAQGTPFLSWTWAYLERMANPGDASDSDSEDHRSEFRDQMIDEITHSRNWRTEKPAAGETRLRLLCPGESSWSRGWHLAIPSSSSGSSGSLLTLHLDVPIPESTSGDSDLARFVDYFVGSKSLQIPTPFPCNTRPWLEAPDPQRIEHQTKVLLQILDEIWRRFT